MPNGPTRAFVGLLRTLDRGSDADAEAALATAIAAKRKAAWIPVQAGDARDPRDDEDRDGAPAKRERDAGGWSGAHQAPVEQRSKPSAKM
ncbi:MAG: hypothetical protein R2862_01125 [Thermoanaerobaculia bacterium]